MAARPIVDGIVSKIQDEFNVLRVDIHTDFGVILRERMQFSSTPEFILFDADGQEVWRGHSPPSPAELALAK